VPGGASPARLAEIDSSFRALEDGERGAPRDRWDPDYIVHRLGSDPARIVAWVRDSTWWIPYRGRLRGPVGVLMDRQGNSLDRALLLATLLRGAGETVRLAHGEMSPAAAMRSLPRLVAMREVGLGDVVDRLGDTRRDRTPAIRAAAAQYHLDGEVIANRVRQMRATRARAFAELRTRVADQSERLLRALPRPDSTKDQSRRLGSAARALRDHWWVQHQVNGAWIDADLLDSSAAATTPLATPAATLGLDEVAGATLDHEIVVRLIVEQWARGAFAERTALETTLHPADLIGENVTLQLLPMDWVTDSIGRSEAKDDLRAATLAEESWVAMLLVGHDLVARTALMASGDDPEAGAPGGGPMGGLGGALAGALGNASGQAKAPAHQFTAAWLEYEIRVPGEAPRRIRRTVVDLIGPAARAAGAPRTLQLTDDQRYERGLALTMRTEILPLVCQLAPAFVAHLGTRSLLANREVIRAAARGALALGSRAADSVIGSGASMPTLLYSLALARSDSESRALTFVAQPNILAEHVYAERDSGGVSLLDATDIVANELGVDLLAGDAFAVRVRHGVRETNAESVLRLGSAIARNTGDAFAASRDWTAVTSAADGAAGGLVLPDDAKQRIADDLRDGDFVVAPLSPFGGPHRFGGWWQVDSTTGTTVGLSARGWGDGEYSANLARANLASRWYVKAMVRFAGAFTNLYMWCVLASPAVQVVNDVHAHGLRGGLHLSMVASVKECAGDAGVIALISVALPLVMFSVEESEAASMARAREFDPQSYPEPQPAGKQPPPGPGRQPPGGGPPPGPHEGPPPPPQEGPPPVKPHEEPPSDPLGKTQPDPSKTQHDPGCQPAELEQPPAKPPESLDQARQEFKAADEASKAAQQQYMDATSEYMRYQVNNPNSGWYDADPSKWDPQVSEALKDQATRAGAASRTAGTARAQAWENLEDAWARENAAKAAAKAGAQGGEPKRYYVPPAAPAEPPAAPACASPGDGASAGAGGLVGE
jgi:hypothetical protein